MIKFLDKLLNNVTMYRLLAIGLTGNALIALIASALDVLSLPFSGLITSLIILLLTSFAANNLLGRYWSVATNNESWLITALILFFVLPPATTNERAILICLAAIIATASKYIITLKGRHIFNPAAFGLFVVGLLGLHSSWWVGSSVLWPFILAFGLVILRKTRKFKLFISFVITSLVVTLGMALFNKDDIADVLSFALTASPLIFLGTVMLTEPITMPSRRNQQMTFGALVGALYAWHPTVGSFFLYPEIALLIGNMYALIVSPKQLGILKLKRIDSSSSTIKNYVFTSKAKPNYLPGQYMEWTLGHKNADMRGNRRTFTIASSPTEKDIILGVRFYDKPSTFKQTLQKMKLGDKIYTTHIGGDFVLPEDTTRKITMIAGGVGITPFRSMLKYITDTNQQRDIHLYYLVNDLAEVAYEDVLNESAKHGVKVFRLVSPLDLAALTKNTPDFTDRLTYISGPNAMVEHYNKQLLSYDVPRNNIKTDYFAGY